MRAVWPAGVPCCVQVRAIGAAGGCGGLPQWGAADCTAAAAVCACTLAEAAGGFGFRNTGGYCCVPHGVSVHAHPGRPREQIYCVVSQNMK